MPATKESASFRSTYVKLFGVIYYRPATYRQPASLEKALLFCHLATALNCL